MPGHVAQRLDERVGGVGGVRVGELGAGAPVVGQVQVDPVVDADPVGDPVARGVECADVGDDLQGVEVCRTAGFAEVVAPVDVQPVGLGDIRARTDLARARASS
ncbi:hypothetical protein [Streptomyces exfoliatus]|uniref:hypothetical protein n=1 Tax=Streptomyces exfoliatus TaxID=1905 RepID=UPI003F4D1DE4